MRRISKEALAELDRIAERDGKLDPEVVVRESKRKRSPLHPYFLWGSDAKAAHIGRIQIARQLIVRVRISHVEAENLNVSTRLRKYHGNVGGGYYSVDVVANDEQLRTKLLESALRELRAFRSRYSHLQELQPILDAIDAALPPAQAKGGKGTARKRRRA